MTQARQAPQTGIDIFWRDAPTSYSVPNFIRDSNATRIEIEAHAEDAPQNSFPLRGFMGRAKSAPIVALRIRAAHPAPARAVFRRGRRSRHSPGPRSIRRS